MRLRERRGRKIHPLEAAGHGRAEVISAGGLIPNAGAGGLIPSTAVGAGGFDTQPLVFWWLGGGMEACARGDAGG